MLEFGGVGVKNNAGTKASLGTLSREPHVGASEMSHTWGKGPDRKDPVSLLAQKTQARHFHVGLPQGPGDKTCARVPPRGPCRWQRVGTAADRDE